MTAWTRYRHLIVGSVAVVLLVTFAGLTVHYRDDISVVERRVLELLAPVQRAATETGRALRGFWDALTELQDLRAETIRLRAEVDRLRALEPLLAEAEAENRRLRDLLEFEPLPAYRQVAARVIGRSLSNWFSTVEVNRGATAGIEVDMAVVTHLGLVGRVVRVTSQTSTILLLVDPQSGVGAEIIRSREPGAVVGNVSFEDTCVMRMFSRDADVRAGDTVLTSGLGDVFPRGLHIGSVTEVARAEQGLLVVAHILPAVDFTRLEEVFVLVPE